MENNIIDINTHNISIFKLTKNFYNLCYNQKNINITINNGLIPFGIEKYNDKIILNIELLDNNDNNNIISKLESLENEMQNYFKNYGIINTIKKSKLGYIVRTHYLKSSESYILKKNGEKMIIDESNLQNAECDINLLIKGIWINDNNYGLYIIVNSIKINKFN
jgi:hypothetical protein